MNNTNVSLLLALLIVPLCSCGTDLALNSIDQEVALEKLRSNQLSPRAHKISTSQNSQIVSPDNQGVDPGENVAQKTDRSRLHPDDHMVTILRDDKDNIRTIGKPALTLDSNAAKQQTRYEMMK